jgi:oligoribonuclease NrnB/cAMP/cGMP phosphodiesterase (DHH superfamily)
VRAMLLRLAFYVTSYIFLLFSKPRKVNDTISTIVCSHESDLDGIFSASIASIKFPEADISFYNYGRSNFEKMFEHIMLNVKKEATGKIIISDLGINPDVEDLSISAIREFSRMEWKVIWVDHHPWSKEVKSSIAPMATVIHDESGQRCASELMLEYIRLDSKVAKQLSIMAHAMDFMTGGVYMVPISELIQYYRNLPHSEKNLTDLARKAANGVLWDTEMQSTYGRYLSIYEKERQRAWKSLVMRKIAGLDVAFLCISNYIQSSLFSKEVFSKTGADLCLLYGTNGRVSIRRNNNKTSCRIIASFLVEGGGHDYAAGGKLKSIALDTDACVSELEEVVRIALK